MTLAFTEEQEVLRKEVRRALGRRWDATRLHAAIDAGEGFDRELWEFMARDLGLTAMAIPEEYGGVGYGFAEQAVVLEELGRALVTSPYLSTAVLAVAALLRGDDEELRSNWLPRIAEGQVVAAVAHLDEDGQDLHHTSRAQRVLARSTPEGWRVSGTSGFVIDGAQADLLILAATVDGPDGGAEEAVVAVEAAAGGIETEELPALDLTRPLATVRLSDAPARVVATGDRARQLVEQVLEVAAVALACEQVGGATRAMELSVEYAKTRQQFGVPIGSFQAVQFMCADMLLAVEAARSAALYGAFAVDGRTDDLPVAASVAKAVCSDAYSQVTASTIQVHGGIGYTWEHSAHLYFKRAKASESLFGTAAEHRERLLTLTASGAA